MDTTRKRCCICGHLIGKGRRAYNASPLSHMEEDVCCGKCNRTVILARIVELDIGHGMSYEESVWASYVVHLLETYLDMDRKLLMAKATGKKE